MTSPARRMPSHLSHAQRLRLEQLLLEERTRIRRALSRRGWLRAVEAEHEAGSNRMPQHMADLGTETMQETLDGALASRETYILTQIDAALRRLYRRPHEYGTDEATGEPIPFERLEVIPWARRAMGLAVA